MRRGFSATAWLVLVATLFLWAGNWVVARGVRDEIAPGLATAGRLVIVLALLLPFTAGSLRRKLPGIDRRGWQTLAAIGLAGGGLHLALQWLAMHYTTATSATLYLSVAPVFILLLARPLLGERIVPRQWLGVLLSFCGVAFIGTQGRFSLDAFNLGDALTLMSMMLWSLYTVFLRLRRDALDTPEFLVLLCAFGLLWTAPWVAWELLNDAKAHLSRAGTLAMLYSAIGSLLLAYAGWSYVVKRLGAARAGVTMHLVPAFTVLLAALFLDEWPRWFHGAGIALILSGVALSSSAPAVRPPASSS
jgi:drug/metabolite transporter (DMT)-like permease